jgi:hypothetical protein
MVLQAKRRPTIVLSSAQENQDRRAVRLAPLFRITEERGWYTEHVADIRAGRKPALFWLDGVPVENAPEPRVIDFARAVRFPLARVNRQQRIALLDDVSLLAVKRRYSEFVLL